MTRRIELLVSALWVLSLCGLVLPRTEAAIRCGGELIGQSESALKVLQYCGKPAAGNAKFLESGEWIYNFGPDQFMVKVVIRNAKVVRTETLGRGFVPPGGTEAEAPHLSLPPPDMSRGRRPP